MHALPLALSAPEGLDYFVRAILPPYPEGMPGGGDPGWLWYAIEEENGDRKVVVEVYEDIVSPNGALGEYSESMIRYELRAAFNNLCVKFPMRKMEIQRTILRFGLLEVETPDGLEPIPSWSETEPPPYILNDL
jgi:hypothetical protein